MPFILQMHQMILLAVALLAIGFGIAFYLKYPRQAVKYIMLKLMRKTPVPYAMITSDNYLIFDIAPKEKFIVHKENDPKETEGFIPEGETVNIAGFGNGHVFFEEGNIPLRLSAPTLRQRLKDLANHIDYSLISSRLMGDLWTAFATLAYQTGLAKTQKRQTWIMYAILGLAFMSFGIVLALYMQNKSIIAFNPTLVLF